MEATNRKVKVCIASLVALVAFLIYGVSDAFALNDITVRLYGQRELAAGSYTAFCQDSEGFIWIGTDAGLIRFDGNHGDLFRNDELVAGSLSDNKIVSLFSDSDGMLWVGTVNGLNYFDRNSETFRLVELPGLQLNGFINGITELSDGRLLFMAAGIGFYTLDKSILKNKEGKVEAKRHKLAFTDDDAISKMIGMGPREIVFSTRFGDICHWLPDGKIKTVAKINGNPSHLSRESGNTLIVSTQYEAFRINLDSGLISPLSVEGGESIKITDICSAGDVSYVSTAGSGVWEVAKSSSTVVPSHRLHSSTTDLSLMKVGSLFVDQSGNLWLGCNHKGVGMAPSSKGPFVNKSFAGILNGYDGLEVLCIKVVGDNIALGLNNGDVVLLDPDGGMRKTTVSRGNPVTSIASAPDGSLLIGVARDGIWSMDSRSLALSRLVKPSESYP